ncbi:pyruvate/2-oxoglutarate dehydrogenase complex, dihydrolipoamide acyltransferase component [Chthonomonas calidirosea]|uniref:dihydrolipoamide acetyltransferase family protein n=1 Tax=Chthonomonas calidirosea TaxID=454171 RepID=UPI0006DD3F75|nr:dihydrolipoamide acetyltransferase family protein [Chthonomonas calidirosea]CEK20556.1 pyruvate/2-oxoglutarate dehydrogenase complex, dihydrolipoamide acyltransferase component [Chthonomonas calidirosea]
MAEVRMPKMGDGMEEGTIIAWLKKEGETVAKGEAIAEIETDKARVPLESYEEGVLTKILVQPGETVPIGTVVAIVGEPTAQKIDSPRSNGTAASSSTEESKNLLSSAQAPANASTPFSQSAVTTGSKAEERVRASGLARSIAKQYGIDLHQIKGTGPHGRIVERDVRAFLQSQTTPTTSAPAPVVERAPEPSPTMVPGQEVQPSRMRRAIAERTRKSKQNIPHFYVTMVIEMDRARALLQELNADASEGNKITVNDLIIKACAIALSRVPEVNASWTDNNTIVRHEAIHIGIAVGIEEGLIVPVVRDCQAKTLRQISAEAKQLIAKARSGQLKPEEYSGSTFSISNLGMMGVDEFTAIINPPDAAILAVGGIFREPVVVGDTDEIAIRARMKVTLSADHRILDGVVAARFLQELKRVLEAPLSLLS